MVTPGAHRPSNVIPYCQQGQGAALARGALIPDGGRGSGEAQQRLPAQQGMESGVDGVLTELLLAAVLLGALIVVSRV